MFSKDAYTYLSTLVYNPAAERQFCDLPLCDIYWTDEIPDLGRWVTLSEHEQYEVLRLFAIRSKIWDGRRLSQDEQQFWDRARAEIPDCPLFRRLSLSGQEMTARIQEKKIAENELGEFLARADKVTFYEDEFGIQKFSATFDLKKDLLKKESWWKLSGKWIADRAYKWITRHRKRSAGHSRK